MLFFENDYSEGAHEKVLEALVKTNMTSLPGYGTDHICTAAKEKIKAACGGGALDVFLLSGGTQTNAIVIGAMLHPYEAVIAAETGHIAVHEAGAVEHGGHKVLTLPQHEGKLHAPEIDAFIDGFYADETHEHMPFPGMVYISHPTEYGTLYTKNELESISKVCAKHKIPLYLDGARLGYGLMANGTDVTLPDLAEFCDAFYIGGTKVGALCGEALVFKLGKAPKHFFTTIKQNGALLAKSRLLGVQFDALFTDSLYFEISRHAIEMAMLLKNGLVARGISLYIDSCTNQQFVILQNTKLSELKKHVRFSFWEKLDAERSVIRLATSWATTKQDIEKLLDLF